MTQDIDAILQDWRFEPDTVQARLVKAGDGRQVLQVRIDLGVLQLETTGRPDGTRPRGHASYLALLQSLAKRDPELVMNDDQCREADREFVQYYHRRLAWLALRQYADAVRDADHTLAFMDFVKAHSPTREYTAAHEQYRAFVLFHRTQAAAALAVDQEKTEQAVDEIRGGLASIRRFMAERDAEERLNDDAMVQALQQMEKSLRETHGIEFTLRERLETAIANEEYEMAAKLRDELRRRT